jgi:thiosulfate dehydrogenase
MGINDFFKPITPMKADNQPDTQQEFGNRLLKTARLILYGSMAIVVLVVSVLLLLVFEPELSAPRISQSDSSPQAMQATALSVAEPLWKAPDLAALPATAEGDQIRYGRELIAHTARYLGPKGSVLQISNGMNCQNCHLDAGTRPFGNNYSLVAATYPKFRARSGTEEDVVKRVNDCLERSLNGQALPAESGEMQAMVAYIQWVGNEVPKGEKVPGAGLMEIAMLDRAANPELGKALYQQQCQLCHGAGGEGQLQADGSEYIYPPLWGDRSYNRGAGLYRLSAFARYVKANMPLGATHDRPILSDEEAWDLAAYVNSMPHPEKDLSRDWPDISQKPFDHPFGPFADAYSEQQHKFGPFKPIIEAREKAQ